MARLKASRLVRPFVSLAAKSITIQILISFAVAGLIAPISNSQEQTIGGGDDGNGNLGRRDQVMQNQPSGPTTRVGQDQELQTELDRPKRRTASSKPNSVGKTPEFVGAIGNVSAVLGRDVRLVCTVENLGQHQVAWLKEETKTILSIDTNIIITNYRIFLIPDDEERKWVLHIKDVQESDRGSYQCQINTNPMRSISGYLDVVVPPSLILAESTQVAEVMENSNVSLQCKASGHPRPSVGWHRDDGEPIKLTGANSASGTSSVDNNERSEVGRFSDNINTSIGTRQSLNRTQIQKHPQFDQKTTMTYLNDVRSDRLLLTNVDRSMAGIYICTATNGIPSPASMQIPLYVKFAPKVSIPMKTISVSLGEQLEIDCLIEAFPKPTSYWSERQYMEPPNQVKLFRNDNSAQGDLRLQRLGSLPSPRWHQDHKILMAKRATPSRPQLSRRESFGLNERSDAYVGDSTKTTSWKQLLQRQRRQRRQVGGSGDPDEWDETDNQVDEPDAHLEDNRREVPSLNSSSSTKSENNLSKEGLIQRLDSLNKAFVTVKQTALNSYTYKLKISIAKMRPKDFGEYVCISSNTVGTASAKVFVKRTERNQTPVAVAVESTLDKPFSLTDSNDNQTGYQRDGMNTNGLSQAVWSSSQFIQAQKSHRSQQTELRTANSPLASRQSNRVYDENYLQSIRNRQSSNNYIISSSAFGSERNSASCQTSFAQATTLLFVLWGMLVVLGLFHL